MKYLVAILFSFVMISCASTGTSESTGQFVDSSAITAKIKAKLVGDKRVSALDVSVKTYKGTVQLSGFVSTSEQRSLAEEIARGVEGVKEVQNKLEIK
ncbi:BON domain-containing protein [Bacteriovorax sp. DB6_IX]|uniref:BON domain-containing protein n=1 Tax=Bacteriovorax sp. DB6_IX TaxID=1353530 RepID=UPI00038A3685|nr:BON domain-containing protein [Bacteriovorax sp. DB6_IX]EQC49107.1 BON domain protein [Bacteriovorax sp. DB6_IX]